MATTDITGYYTLMDVVNDYTSLDAKGTYLWAARTMSRKCPFVLDMPMIASNQIMSNVGLRESYLPTPGTRRFGEGVTPTASHSTPFSEPIAMVEDYGEVDFALWKIQNDPNAWRQQKDSQKVEAMTQKMENLIIYGSLATDTAAFNGFATRFNVSTFRPNDDTTWPYSVQLNGGSGSDLTRILMIQWGPGKVYGVYPKNLPGGLQIEDLGRHTVQPALTTRMEVLRAHFSWFMGIVVEDERCVQTIANIETAGTENIFDEDLLITAINRLPDPDSGRVSIYCSRSIKTQMDIRAKDKTNVYYTQEANGDVWGRRVTYFQGIPVRMAEKLIDTETAIA